MDFTCVLRTLAAGQLVIICLLLSPLPGVGAYICNQCDCLISYPTTGDKAIVNVKPKCREGKITWLSSYGAIRLELDPGYAGDYRFCFLVESDDIKTIVSQEVLSRSPGNYKLKILDNIELRLSPLFMTRGRSREHCISGSGSLRLYMETEREVKDGGAAKVKIHYDIEKTVHSLHYSSMDECRPCTDAELLSSYCSSDFVAVGSMDDVTHDATTDMSTIKVSVKQLLSQKGIIFHSNVITRRDELKGEVYVPLRCGIRHGKGEFLFTGRVRLGRPVLHCAPRYEQWKVVLDNAFLNGDMECSYNS